jgi:hypothetical protein
MPNVIGSHEAVVDDSLLRVRMAFDRSLVLLASYGSIPPLRSIRRQAATTGPSGTNLPALKPTLGPNGDLSPANFDRHGTHLPT